MTALLVILPEPERSAMRFDRLHGVAVTSVATLADAAPHLAATEILVTIGPALGLHAGAAVASAPNLRWIASIGTGTDRLTGHGPAVTNVRGVHGAQMSEAALAAMLALARDLPRVLANQGAARWDRFAPRLLAGSTVSILGLGAIAEALAPRCAALGMTVVGISGSPRAVAGFDRIEPRDDLHRVAATLDYLVVLTPLSDDTRHLIDASVLAAMKPTAFLVNLARGGVVDETALLAALDAGTIAGAALDVFATEPLPTDSRFWGHERVIVTPHLGGFHAGYADAVVAQIGANVAAYLDGGVAALTNRVE